MAGVASWLGTRIGVARAGARHRCRAMADYQHIVQPFEPVFDGCSRVLVLGSFPSALSRERAFYYGNPRNRFWRVVAACIGEEAPADGDVDGKRSLLLRHGIALWDVIESCDIKGSSDASIKNVVPARTGLPATVLPSTSPANAAWSEARLIECWRPHLKKGTGTHLR